MDELCTDASRDESPCVSGEYNLVWDVQPIERNKQEVNSGHTCQAKLQLHCPSRATKSSEQQSDTL